MNRLARELNRTLGSAAAFLSPAGRRMYFPSAGILGQGAEAKKCEINATIGMAFEEDGSPLVMDCFASRVGLGRKSFLYAGSYGLPALRDAWKAMEIRKKVLGTEHPDYAKSLNNLACYYTYLGNYSEAWTCFKQGAEVSWAYILRSFSELSGGFRESLWNKDYH